MAREERRAHLGVRSDLEPVLAMGALAPKAKDGGRQVVADLLLLGVVADASADVAVAGAAPYVERLGRVARRRGRVSGRQQRQRFARDTHKLEPNDQDPLVDFAGPVSQRMLFVGR